MKALVAALAIATAPAAFLPLEPTADFSVDIVSFDSPIHDAGQDLNVNLSLNVPSGVDTVDIEVLTHGSVPSSRQALTNWLGSESAMETPSVVYQGELEVSQASDLTSLKISAENLNWGRDIATWGPRGIEVRVSTSETSVTDRSIMVTTPSFELTPMEYTTVIPVAVQATDLSVVPPLDPAITDPSLSPVIDSAVDRSTQYLHSLTAPGISVGLDSELVTDQKITDAASRFTSPDTHEVFLLPAFDADLSAWLNTGQDDLFAPYFDQSGSAQDELARVAVPARTDIYYQSAPLTTDLIDYGKNHGYDTFITNDAILKPSVERYWTPSALATLPEHDDIAGLVVDSELSAILTNQLLLGDAQELSDFDRQQLLLALSAIHYRERPNDPRPLVFEVSRETMATLDDISLVNSILETLSEAPWLEPSTISGIEDGPQDDSTREQLRASDVAHGELSSSEARSFVHSEKAIATVLSTTDNPQAFAPALRAQEAVIVSQATKSDPALRNAVLSNTRDLAERLHGVIMPNESSTVNLIAQDSSFPVRITSTLPIPATVEVRMTSSDRRLEFTPTEVTLSPDSTTTATVPVKAVGSGNVSVTVSTYTLEGEPLGSPVTIDVRVRADWENLGTGILAGLFLVILIVGIIRSARRGTRRAAHEAHVEEGSRDG